MKGFKWLLSQQIEHGLSTQRNLCLSVCAGMTTNNYAVHTGRYLAQKQKHRPGYPSPTALT